MMGGATHADTMSADSIPITATPMNVPAFCLSLATLSRVWMKLGIWMVNKPNMDVARTTNRRLNTTMIQGWLKVAFRFNPLPMAAAATPAPV